MESEVKDLLLNPAINQIKAQTNAVVEPVENELPAFTPQPAPSK